MFCLCFSSLFSPPSFQNTFCEFKFHQFWPCILVSYLFTSLISQRAVNINLIPLCPRVYHRVCTRKWLLNVERISGIWLTTLQERCFLMRGGIPLLTQLNVYLLHKGYLIKRTRILRYKIFSCWLFLFNIFPLLLFFFLTDELLSTLRSFLFFIFDKFLGWFFRDEPILEHGE